MKESHNGHLPSFDALKSRLNGLYARQTVEIPAEDLMGQTAEPGQERRLDGYLWVTGGASKIVSLQIKPGDIVTIVVERGSSSNGYHQQPGENNLLKVEIVEE